MFFIKWVINDNKWFNRWLKKIGEKLLSLILIVGERLDDKL